VDTRTLRRKVNEVKAKAEERRGPAGHSQDDAPLLDALRRFHAEDTLSLAIPAHKSGAGAPEEALALFGARARRAPRLQGRDDRLTELLRRLLARPRHRRDRARA
jgi:hypothetical protein